MARLLAAVLATLAWASTSASASVSSSSSSSSSSSPWTVPTFSDGVVVTALPAYAVQTGFSSVGRAPPFAPNDTVPVCTPANVCNTTVSYDPNTPLVACTALPDAFLECTVNDFSELTDSDYAQLTSTQQQFGCRTWSNLPGETIGSASAVCTVADNVVCVGNRTFAVPDIACIKSVTASSAPRHSAAGSTDLYGGFQYPSIVLFSLFLGWAGVDRFCLQWTCLGTVKMLTIGGLGVWWLTDLILLTLGQLAPADGSLWDPSW